MELIILIVEGKIFLKYNRFTLDMYKRNPHSYIKTDFLIFKKWFTDFY